MSRHGTARHETGRVDLERGESDPIRFDEVLLHACCVVDRDLQCDAAELTALIAELERYPPWSITRGVHFDLDRRGLAGDGEAVPGALHNRRVEACQPVLDPSGEHDVEVRRRPGANTEAQLHRRAALDDEEMASIGVANLVEHGTHHTDADEVHDPLRQLADLGGVTLQQPLELFGSARSTCHWTMSPSSE